MSESSHSVHGLFLAKAQRAKTYSTRNVVHSDSSYYPVPRRSTDPLNSMPGTVR